MKLYIENPPAQLADGLNAFCALHGIVQSTSGTRVTICESGCRDIIITKNEDSIICKLERPYQLYRALTLIKANRGAATYTVRETCYFQTLAAMFDGSQASSLMTVDSVKKMLLYLAGMGYNMLMLYCEDCFELSGEPYWGNMRPRYTKAEFRELDTFAHTLGIEMIPCIQTLAHLTDAIKRPPYAPLSDTASVLMVGDERVYTLIDKIIGEVSSCFRSRRIHIGMDEAWDLGLGNYLKQHGYTPSGELVRQHLCRVMEIVQHHGLSPMMWADMFFRARSKTKAYRDLTVTFTEEDRCAIPADMHLVYWDYYRLETAEYDTMLQKCQYLTEKTIFAGCARNVRTFATHNSKTFATTAASLAACKARGVREVIATVWGDDHRESSNFAVLQGLQCFAEHAYTDAPDEAQIGKRVTACTGIDAEVFLHIDALDKCDGYNGDNIENVSLTRAIIWQDVLLGLMDKDLAGFDFTAHYQELAMALRQDAETHPELASMLRFYQAIADVCAIKAGIGHKLVDAYQRKDTKDLQQLKDTALPQLHAAMCHLRVAHRTHFFEEYKPIGWEILDIRYGGAIMRLDTAMMRLGDYLDGRLDRIEELEEERLHFSETGKVRHTLNYNQICSASRI